MALSPATGLANYSAGISSSVLHVDSNSDRVGIGTTNPQDTLQVGTAITMGSGTITATQGNFQNVSIAGTLTYEDVTSIDSVGIITAQSGINVVSGGIVVSGGATVVGLSTFTKIAIGHTTEWPGYPALPPNLHVHSNTTETSGACGISYGPDTHGTGPRHVWMAWDSSSGNNEAFMAVYGGRLSLSAEQGVGLGTNVGIGTTTSPGSERLHVVGDSKFVGTLTANSLDLITIATSKSNTAVDVFVYDTSKDSDGGAWRKRTSHTSWYNETLGTATRGSRKEFPAVAVIVGTSTEIIIYDGDDPDLPLWMKFSTGGGDTHWVGTQGPTALSMINGQLISGNVGGVRECNFISEYMIQRRAQYSATKIYYGNIAGRNGDAVRTTAPTGIIQLIVNDTVNDVAMTVLPNAPIDPSTGLQIPTIAVGSNGSMCVIKDDGIVVDYTGFSPSEKVAIDSKYVYSATRSGIEDYIFKSPFLSADASYGANITTGSGGWYANSVNNGWETPTLKNMTVTDVAITKDSSVIRSGNDGIEVFDGNVTTIDGNEAIMPFAYITSDYNTGYMHGDIKLATVSSNVGTAITFTNLSTNGDLANSSDLASWTAYNATLSFQTDAMRVADGGQNSKAYQSFTTVNGRRYIASVNCKTLSGSNALLSIGNAIPAQNSWNNNGTVQVNTTGVKFLVFTASGTTNYIELGSTGGGFAEYQNVRIDEVKVEDRSVNNNPLEVFGTITKTPVATGADLVAYSGFTSNNWLEQPYNADLNFGTGDYSIMLWLKNTTNTGHQYILSLGVEGDATPFRMGIRAGGVNNDGTPRTIAFNQNGSVNNGVDSGMTTNGQWQHICVARTSGITRMYVDSLDKGSTSNLADFTLTTNHRLRIGRWMSNSALAAQFTSVALVRISRSAPTAEQIKKMYDDEKVLFQENAKATLYGSSDAVTALAYDEVTDQLHVGTSSGRSDFQGLRRINNTTDPVTAAISAHDTFIIEQ